MSDRRSPSTNSVLMLSRHKGVAQVLTCYMIALALAAALACADSPAAQTSARSHLSSALRLMGQGRWQEAIKECDAAQASATTPAEKVEAALLKARVLWASGRFAESAAEYRRAATLPGANDYHRLEAWRGAVRAAAAARDAQAERQAIEQLLKLPRVSDSERSRLLTRLGQLLLQQGDRASAMRIFRQVAAQFPSQPAASTARRHLISELIGAGQLQAAQAMLAQAREHNWPGAEDLHVRAAQLLALAGHQQEALQVFRNLLQWRPSSEAGWRAGWRLFRDSRRLGELLDLALNAAKTNEPAAAAVGALAESMGLDNDPETMRLAMSLYKRLLEIAPDDPRLLRGAARLALRLSDLSSADAYSRRLIQHHPTDTAALLVRAQVLAKLGRTDQALPLLKRAAHFDPHDLPSAQRMAAMLTQLGMDDMVLDVVRQVRQSTANPRAMAAELARLHAKHSRWTAAVNELAAALNCREISPRYAQLIVRSWLTDVTAHDQLTAALRKRYQRGQLPDALIPPYIHALVLSGDVDGARRVLEALSISKASAVASEVLKWSIDLPRHVRQVLYEAVLQQPGDPVRQAQLAAAFAADLAATGRWKQAADVLRRHNKPGLPAPLAREYQVRLAEALVRIGDIEGARKAAKRWAVAGDARAAVVMARCALADADYSAVERWATACTASQAVTEPAPWPTAPGTTTDPPAARATFLVAEAFLRRGRTDDATRVFRKVIDKWPDSEAATEAVGRLALIAQLLQQDQPTRRAVIDFLCALDRGDLKAAEKIAAAGPQTGEIAVQLQLALAQAQAPVDPSSAAARLQEVAARFPASSAAPYALYLAARLLAPDRPGDARRLAQHLIATYPSSAIAPLAEQLMSQLPDATERG